MWGAADDGAADCSGAALRCESEPEPAPEPEPESEPEPEPGAALGFEPEPAVYHSLSFDAQ